MEKTIYTSGIYGINLNVLYKRIIVEGVYKYAFNDTMLRVFDTTNDLTNYLSTKGFDIASVGENQFVGVKINQTPLNKSNPLLADEFIKGDELFSSIYYTDPLFIYVTSTSSY